MGVDGSLRGNTTTAAGGPAGESDEGGEGAGLYL